MRLSKQHKQILLVLLRNNPRALRPIEIIRLVGGLRWKRYETKGGKSPPRLRVLSASICRSLKTLHARGLITKESKWSSPRWRLTTKGLATAREINRELKSQIEKLDEFRYFLLYEP
jgi:hypothetical protein